MNLRINFDFVDRASETLTKAERLVAGLGEAIDEAQRFAALPSIEQDYARRVGRETVVSVSDAAGHARSLALAGLGEHVDATCVCERIPLGRVWSGPEVCYSVGVRAVEALAASRSSVELRTPPASWTTPPPLQLFEAGPV